MNKLRKVTLNGKSLRTRVRIIDYMGSEPVKGITTFTVYNTNRVELEELIKDAIKHVK